MSSKEITLAVDAMGGDFGIRVTVPAAIRALNNHPNLVLYLVGDQDKINTFLQRYRRRVRRKSLFERIIVHHASQQVEMDELPSQALRYKKDSSMRVVIDLVKAGKAQAVVSAGNTGALMATARFVLKTLPGIDRPAIITCLPTLNPERTVRILDLGANIGASAEHLYQFAVMGSVLASAVDNIERPKVSLLNIGEEEIKGNETVKQAAQLLTDSEAINYVGFLEGTDIFKGNVDVIVCEGFVGNVALKAIEGVSKLVSYYVRQEFHHGFYPRIAGLIATPVLKKVKEKLDPGRYNGASFIGLKGIVIKSHGNANKGAFYVAINEAVKEVTHNVPAEIQASVTELLGTTS